MTKPKKNIIIKAVKLIPFENGEKMHLRKKNDLPQLSSGKIKKLLLHKERYNIICFPALSSTQSNLKRFAAHGAEEGLVLIADSQSGGRGREGRSFFSPRGSGIYMSILFRPSDSAPSLSPKKLVHITTSAAVAVSEAIEAVTGKKTDIKWVNDIFYDGLKVSGILTEAVFDETKTGYDFITLGIGINLYKNGFPSELQGVAGALYRKKPFNLIGLKTRLIAEILNRVDCCYRLIGKEDFSYVNKYRERSMVIGKDVDIIVNDKKINSGRVLSLTDDCALEVKTESGELLTLSYGEVRIKLSEKQ